MRIQKINIGILSGEEISIDLLGDFSINKSNEKITGKCIVNFERNVVKLKCNNKIYTKEKDFLLTPSYYETEMFRLNNVKIGMDFHWEQQKNLMYQGSLKFVINEEELTAINIINIDDYLRSVISSEMSPKNSVEFLKAHAIVSRSWLISQLLNKGKTQMEFTNNSDEHIVWHDKNDHNLFDVCADDHCQRYQGISKIRNENVDKAIKLTKGLVLTFDKKVLDARYSKCCGGKTELFENVWEPTPSTGLQSIFDYKYPPDEYERNLTDEKCARRWFLDRPKSFCDTDDENLLDNILVDFDKKTQNFFRWQIIYSQKDIAALINKNLGMDFGRILDLQPIKRGESGRLIKLKIIGEKKTLTIGKELEIRRVLSEKHLYSSAFFVEKEDIKNNVPQKFILNGAGWGHGVGLCQIGAAVMAGQNYRFDEILLHYFPQAKIEKAY